MHVTIDGEATPTEKWSIAGVYGYCRESVALAKMTLISGPHVTASQGHLYGIAILAESHVSVHLDKRSGRAHLDLFSCNDFEIERWVNYSRDWFTLSKLQTTKIDRGLYG